MDGKILRWNDLDGSILLGKVFSRPVEISQIDIFKVTVDREGPTVIIEFDIIGVLPDNPPVKWGKNFNRCHGGLNCSGVASIATNGISSNMPADIEIKKIDQLYKIIITGDDISIMIECLHAGFMGPSVYVSE